MVEDDVLLSNGVKLALQSTDDTIIQCFSIKEARQVDTASVSLIVLDINLPDGNGLDYLQELKIRYNVPIILLTANDMETDIVTGIELGADDYIAKPFRIRELLARMKAILRRSGNYAEQQQTDKSIVNVGDAKVNISTAKVYRGNEEIILTAMEYKLLLIFIQHRGENISRHQILSQIWDDAGDFVNDNTLSVYIKRLRKKLGDSEDSQLIQTVRGIGYRMD